MTFTVYRRRRNMLEPTTTVRDAVQIPKRVQKVELSNQIQKSFCEENRQQKIRCAADSTGKSISL